MKSRQLYSVILGFFCAILLPFSAYGSSLQLSNLSQSDYENAVKDISSAWSYTSVSGASTLGRIFGFELGVVAGGAKTPKIDSLSQSAGGGSIPELPSGALYGAVTVPFGITVEAEGIPDTTISGVSAKSEALAIKWTFSKLLKLPIDLAARAYASSLESNFAGTVSGTYTTYDIKDSMTGAEIEASKKFLFVEPYVVAGIIQADGKMNVSGYNQVFNVSGQMSDSATVSGSKFMVGADFHLTFLRLGAEVGSVFGDTRAAAKLSLAF